jgi:hypothetical protein
VKTELPIAGKQVSNLVLIRIFTLQHLLIWRATPRSPVPGGKRVRWAGLETPNRLDARARLPNLPGRCQAFF